MAGYPLARTMKLYITAGSPYARMARIVILEKGLESRVEIIAAQRSRSPAASGSRPGIPVFAGAQVTRNCATGSTASPHARRSQRPRRRAIMSGVAGE